MVLGIDCSHWSGVMDWNKAVSAGARYAWVKATEAVTFKDSQFERNWSETDGKLPRGAYHFWRAASDPVAQARHFANTVGSDRGELPPMLDIEDVYAPKMTSKVVSDIVSCAVEIKKLFGGAPIIYTAKWYWDSWIATPNCLAGWDLAVAHYTTASQPLMPKGWTKYKVWQKSADGNRKGPTFGGQCDDMDLDYFNGTDAEFMAWAGITVMPLTLEERVASLEQRVSKLEGE